MAIPIIGQPVIEDFSVTVVIGCPCGRRFLLQGQLDAIKLCPNKDCDKVYRIAPIPVMILHQAPAPTVGLVLMTPDGTEGLIKLAQGSKKALMVPVD